MCPDFTGASVNCRDTGYGYGLADWSVSGGGGQIEGTLTIEDDSGRTFTDQVSGHSGRGGYGPPCGSEPRPFVTFTLEVHDECGHTISATCGTTTNREPCH